MFSGLSLSSHRTPTVSDSFRDHSAVTAKLLLHNRLLTAWGW